jgi:hypothetical protein
MDSRNPNAESKVGVITNPKVVQPKAKPVTKHVITVGKAGHMKKDCRKLKEEQAVSNAAAAGGKGAGKHPGKGPGKSPRTTFCK